MRTRAAALRLLSLSPYLVAGLLVVPTSPQCAVLCGNTLDATSGAEISCDDSTYATSTYGATFKACVACELSSTYYDATRQADLQWAIYNLRYALAWCLWGFDNNTNVADTPCLTSFSCAPLQSAIEYDALNQDVAPYSFCSNLTEYQNSARSCSGCLRETGNENYLSNFVTVLEAACIQQPAPGDTLSLQGYVFSSSIVNITTPSATPSYTYTPRSGGLTLDEEIGIAAGGVVLILIIAGFCIVWRGKRRRRAVLAAVQKSSGYAEWSAQMSGAPGSPDRGASKGASREMFFESPQSQRPLRRALSWDHHVQPSPEENPYFSTYHSPISPAGESSHTAQWPLDVKGGYGQSPGFMPMGAVVEMQHLDHKDPRGPEWQRQSPPPSRPERGYGGGGADYDERESRLDIREGMAF